MIAIGFAAVANKHRAAGLRSAKASKFAALGVLEGVTRTLDVGVNLGLSAHAVSHGILNGSVLEAGLGAVGLGLNGARVANAINKAFTHGVSDAFARGGESPPSK